MNLPKDYQPYPFFTDNESWFLKPGDCPELVDIRKELEVSIFSNSSETVSVKIRHIPTDIIHQEEGKGRRATELNCMLAIARKVIEYTDDKGRIHRVEGEIDPRGIF